MTDHKAWYFSRTIWASLVTIGSAAAGAIGLPVGEAEGAELTDWLLNALTAASGLIAILGRISAKDRIG